MLSLYANTKEDIMFAYNLWQWIAFFIIYCLIGWIGESLYVSWEHRKWVNRGFLHGPFRPIYGFGAVIILISTIPVRNNYFLIFLFGMLVPPCLNTLPDGRWNRSSMSNTGITPTTSVTCTVIPVLAVLSHGASVHCF